MEIGKIFEKEFKESIPEHCYYLRLKDGTAAYGQNNDKVRFQAHNICDCIVFGNEYSYFIELKNCNVTSLPFTNIRETQLEEMSKVNHPKIKTYFVVCFRMKERCFIAEAKKIKEFNKYERQIRNEWKRKNVKQLSKEEYTQVIKGFQEMFKSISNIKRKDVTE